MKDERYQQIEDYGIIGDLNTVALVGVNGSIDFMCFPEFDSPSIFARLLDFEKGGYFRVAPVLEDVINKQIYLSGTNVLLTRFLSQEGVAEISDFMPIAEEVSHQMLVRRAKSVRGEVLYHMTCSPAFDYGRAFHEVERVSEREVIFTSSGDDGLVLRLTADVPLEIKNGQVHAEFRLKAPEMVSFVLEQVMPEAPYERISHEDLADLFKETVNYWHDWVEKSSYQGRWREMVMRSALTLKLLTARKYGSIIAAPTFSLPEYVGGERNWDYRFTWVRDAAFTIYAFIRLGYTEEAGAFMAWIEEVCRRTEEHGPMPIMFRTDGNLDLNEEVLQHFEGYKGSGPVRIGNGAAKQLQLDIYGELLDAVYLYNKYGEPISHDFWLILVGLIEWVRENWDQPDEGIWEFRSNPHNFLYSRLMCWVALDRAIRLAIKRSFPAPLGEWERTRDEIYDQIFEEYWDEARGAFLQRKGGRGLDAASLLMPLVKFISPTDPRWLSHLEAVEQELVSDSLVHRYLVGESMDDGLQGQEGTFSICTFWYVECLARAGQLNKARFYFEKMLGYANHVGLFSEELGPQGEHLGNYPQAFTHLALISAAYEIDRRLSQKQ